MFNRQIVLGHNSEGSARNQANPQLYSCHERRRGGEEARKEPIEMPGGPEELSEYEKKREMNIKERNDQ